MHIGELAERAELSLRTIRHYDEIGLLKPSARTDGGFRLYTERDLARLLLIRRMKPLGYSLEQMAELLRIADGLDADPEHAVARERLARLIADAEERREKARAQLAMADEFIELLRRR
ncbi:MerR family transcriptional regulator [Microbacterium sp. MEC084]|jgi:DNA-binding transcriptional MerR regulator|uniref:MerR family transcriptional regulator n=1 Tax=unclassified Microbacterium TaxID=2609290 RepID=UPI0006FACB4F|nr:MULTISPECIES: MerR family transcriptional regulator [unclassified Microbacterium]KQZ06599.1 MerR family transcriptional regulator [Microbacterium sp. Root53]MCD1269819.1 MerR family transcriptional regulator [Microbacterium sp. MEC084]